MHARAARIVHGLDWNMPTEQVLAKTNWKTLESTYKLRPLCLAHKCYNGQAPKQICEPMIMKPGSHHYNLQDQYKLTTTRPTTNYLLKSATHRLAIAWNCLPQAIKSQPHLISFKRKLKDYNLDNIDFNTPFTNKNTDYVYY